MNRTFWSQWRGNFLTGLAVVLPSVISVAVLIWLFRNVASVTDLLLLFLPWNLTHKNGGTGPMHWYWSLIAFVWAIVLIGVIGRAARHYVGRKLIEWLDHALLRIPLLNKIYSTVKQVNEAFSPNNRSSFKHVVLIDFPRPGNKAMGFQTGEPQLPGADKHGPRMVGVFVPTTPNPTSGFLIFVPEPEVTRLNMSVADGIKFIVSLGVIAPEAGPAPPGSPATAAPPPAALARGELL